MMKVDNKKTKNKTYHELDVASNYVVLTADGIK